MFNHAVRYMRLGWRLVPVVPNEKRPPFSNWQGRATTDEKVMRDWLEKYPNSGLGTLTGPESNLFVLDIDKRGIEGMARLSKVKGKLPFTVVAVTGGGGFHYFFKWPLKKNGRPQEIRNSAGSIETGIDIRGQGGFIVLPPSLHKSGVNYKWKEGREPWEIELAEAPLWLVKKALQRRQKIFRPPQLAKKGEVGAVAEGSRNSIMFSLGGKLRAQGLGQEEILAALHAANKTRCLPPLEEAEIQEIAAKVSRFPPGYTWRNNKAKTPPKSSTIQKQVEHSIEENQRRPMADLLRFWLLGQDGPKTLKLAWRDGDKAYSERQRRLINRAELKDSFSLEIIDWLLDNASELAILPENKCPTTVAITVWRRWIGSVFFDILGELNERDEKEAITSRESREIGNEIYNILTRQFRIVEDSSDIPQENSIYDLASDSMSPAWKRVGRLGAFIRCADNQDRPYIALRYDLILQFSSPWVRQLPRKGLARHLKDKKIARSETIRESRTSTARCYLIEPDWLRKKHGAIYERVEFGEEKNPWGAGGAP